MNVEGLYGKAFGVDITQSQSLTDEQVEIVNVLNLPANVLPNLRWLIPLSLDDNALRDYKTRIELD